MTVPTRVVLIGAALFTLGQLIGYSVQVTFLPVLVAIIISLLLVLLSTRISLLAKWRTYFLLSIWLFAGVASLITRNLDSFPNGKARVSGQVSYPVEATKEGWRLRIENVSWRQGERVHFINGKSIVEVKGKEAPRPGDRIECTAYLAEQRGPRNPGGFNSKSYWASRGVGSEIIRPIGLSYYPSDPSRNILSKLLLWARQKTRSLLFENISQENSTTALALMTGNRLLWDHGTKSAFARSGLLHLFAISGLHVGILILAIYQFLSIWRIPKRFILPITLLAMWLFVAFIGFSPPTTRAAVMASFMLGGRLLQRQYRPGYGLVLAWVLLLFVSPDSIRDPGFQLSFAGVGSIIYSVSLLPTFGTNKLSGFIWYKRLYLRASNYLLQATVVSLAATIATAPILIYHFGQVSLLGWLVTPIALIILSLALIAGWLGSLMSLFPFIKIVAFIPIASYDFLIGLLRLTALNTAECLL